MKELLGARIKQLRIKKRMTQDTFAKRIGYKHASIISEIESGKKSISTDKLPIVANVLEVDINALFFEEKVLVSRTD
ncbi:helix-turn-helix domain-containing protein [Priestia megaterium]|uniref:helix-turn-helix domain-containing protein n=1 Tax=Priestia megaterium TaxID=1404 RepID=UPI001A94D87C|nr:helix-turn-helix transcriptional regulator [Priestia megaterium]QSX20034.1 helix-turn-helix transcriptional regulator [Priestia megaterium]